MSTPNRPAIRDVAAERHHPKGGTDSAHGLGMAEKNKSARNQAVVETTEHLSTRGIVEIDQHVAAKDEIISTLPAHRPPVEQVDLGERHHLLDLVGDMILAQARPKVLVEVNLRDVLYGTFRVNSAPSRCQRVPVDVGRQDLDLPLVKLFQALAQDDRQRIGFISRRAGGAPKLQLVVVLCGLGVADRRQGLVGETLQLGILPKEIRLVRGQRFHEVLKLFARSVLIAEITIVVARRFAVHGGQTPRNAGLHEESLAILEHHPRLLIDHVADEFEFSLLKFH